MLKKDLEKLCMNQGQEIDMLYEVLNHYDIKLLESDVVKVDDKKVKRFFFEKKRGKPVHAVIRLY